MEFKKIQHGKTFEIISYMIDGKKTDQNTFEEKAFNNIVVKNLKYCNSSTRTDKKTGNFIHTNSFN